MDAFERLVAQARDQLSIVEGREISWREIVRRAGYEDPTEFGRVSYHLLPRNRSRGHHVPAWLIDRLVSVFDGIVTRVQLNRAAAEAAGYELPDGDGDGDGNGDEAAQLVPMVMRVLGSLTPEERRRVGDEVLQVIAQVKAQDRRR